MKKKNIILVIGIVMLLVFSGCSEKAEMPTDPINGMGILSNNPILLEYQFKVLNFNVIRIPNPDPRFFGTTDKAYFMVLLKNSVLDNRLSFDKSQWGSTFLKKVDLVINLIEGNNHQAAIKIIENDIVNIVDKWVYEPHRYSTLLAIETALFMLKTPYELYYIVVDYVDRGDKIVGYAWVQYYTNYNGVFQLEGRNDVFENDPIFCVFANLPEQGDEFDSWKNVGMQVWDAQEGCYVMHCNSYGRGCHIYPDPWIPPINVEPISP